VSFSGAGLSAESGIATFRDRDGDSLWSRYDPAELASPQGFAANPQRVYEWYGWRRSKLATATPNPAHLALASRDDLVHVTQNVDDLLERAGASSDRIHHLHGTITRDRCHGGCGYEEPVALAEPAPLRRCPDCDSWLRPAVVWFGEPLPQAVWRTAETAVREADCLIVVGTSATVYPAAGLIEWARGTGARVIVVNTEASAASEMADAELIGPAGELLPALLATA